MEFLENFIIVDDDKFNNKLCTAILEKMHPTATITDFTDPVAGFNWIAENFSAPGNTGKAILLLDIMMPVMDAWGFLDRFDELRDDVKSRIKIYILSSSVDKSDMSRAQANKHVEYYLIKPLTAESIRLMVHVLNKRLGNI